MTPLKSCNKCGALKPATADFFVRHNRKKDGLHGTCKPCLAAYQRQFRKENEEQQRKYAREWQRQVRLKDPHPEETARSRKNRRLKQFFGIDLAQYEEMYRKQNGVCAICNDPPLPDRSLHVDHDHETGSVRGLLCGRCNLALGGFQDNAALLQCALNYLGQKTSIPLNVIPLRKTP